MFFTLSAVSRVLTATRPPASTPQTTGESCGSPFARRVVSTARWLFLTKSRAASRSIALRDDGLEHVVGDVEVGVDGLDVVVLFKRVDQPQDASGRGLVGERHGLIRQHRELGARERDLCTLERAAYRVQIGRRRRDAPGVALVDNVPRARVERRQHEVVLRCGAPLDVDHALALELPRHGARFGQRTAVAGEDVLHLLPGAVAVVGEALDVDGDTAGGVPLVARRLVPDALELARAALDSAVDRVGGHGAVARLLDGCPQGRGPLPVTPPPARPALHPLYWLR